MPNGSKQYQQTESDCLRNSDGDAFGRNIVCQHRRQHEKSDPQRDFRQQGLSPGWFGAIRRDSMIREHRAILRHSAIRAPGAGAESRIPGSPAGFGPAAGTPPFGRPCREQCGQAEQQGTHCRMQRRLPDPQQVEREHCQRNRKHRNNRKNPFPIHSNILFINIGIDIAPAFIDPAIYCVPNQAIREQRRPQPPSP